MYFIFAGGLAAGSYMGDMVAFISGITFGANSVVMRAQKDSNPADIMFFAHISCVIVSVPFFFLYPPSITVSNIICVSYMGIFQLGLASALFAYGIRRIPAVQAMLTATIEPVLNPVWVLLAIGERPALSVIAGGAVIIAAVVFTSTLPALRRRN
jgi:drug/metabolite transporter (DMT)-like permease